ncbi:MAG: hypothetical protein DI569_12310 [Sphingopyxis macrogoltabida]|uniref:Uncharacterized protein n=1 Tax=Sphingopyxis macrogoltabida TaxID=33050 RepID=A0A2W5KZ60_SPHMC|nr:MAG: hypothetical protein DI569_12310 [Sphingopyxis macrogoltabida]
MFKNLFLSVLMLVAAVPAAAQNDPAQASALAAKLAEGLQSSVGQDFGGGLKIHAVVSEANMLVFTVIGPDGWRAGITPEMVSDALVGGFCKEMPQFFDMALLMRVDSIDGGSLLKGPRVEACPATAE